MFRLSRQRISVGELWRSVHPFSNSFQSLVQMGQRDRQAGVVRLEQAIRKNPDPQPSQAASGTPSGKAMSLVISDRARHYLSDLAARRGRRERMRSFFAGTAVPNSSMAL